MLKGLQGTLRSIQVKRSSILRGKSMAEINMRLIMDVGMDIGQYQPHGERGTENGVGLEGGALCAMPRMPRVDGAFTLHGVLSVCTAAGGTRSYWLARLPSP